MKIPGRSKPTTEQLFIIKFLESFLHGENLDPPNQRFLIEKLHQYITTGQFGEILKHMMKQNGSDAKTELKDLAIQFSIALNNDSTNNKMKDICLYFCKNSAALGDPQSSYYLARVYNQGIHGERADPNLAASYMRICLQSKIDPFYTDGLKYLDGHPSLEKIVTAQTLLKEILEILNKVKDSERIFPPSFAILLDTLISDKTRHRQLTADHKTMEFTDAMATLKNLIKTANEMNPIIPNPIKSISQMLSKSSDYDKIGQDLNQVLVNIGKWDARTIFTKLNKIKKDLDHPTMSAQELHSEKQKVATASTKHEHHGKHTPHG